MVNTGRSRLTRLSALASQTLNVILFDGFEDETISGRAYREGVLMGDPVWARRRKLIDKVFFWDPDHCFASHQADVKFARMIVELSEV